MKDESIGCYEIDEGIDMKWNNELWTIDECEDVAMAKSSLAGA